MQSNALTRLRRAFLALALVLTVPLLWLVHSVNQKVEAQRRLRHQVVAERIFDELERELTRVLEQESQRPSAHFVEQGQSGRWAPYVLGQFTQHGAGPIFIAQTWLQPERRAYLVAELAKLPQVSSRQQELESALSAPASRSVRHPKGMAAPNKAQVGSSASDVLRHLNRAKEDRLSDNY